MQVRYAMILPCLVVAFVAAFFVGQSIIRTTQIQSVKADDTVINFTTSDIQSGYLYEGNTTYANPDYCSHVMVVIKNLKNSSLARQVFTFSGDITNTTFSITGPFVVNTYYKLETLTPSFGVMEIDFGSGNIKRAGIFQYTANKTFSFTYTVLYDKWFTQMSVL